MWRLLKFIVTGSWHEHEWEIIQECNLTDDFGASGQRYHCRCVKCGKITKFDNI